MARRRQAPEGLPRLPTGKAGGIALMASLAVTIALLVLGGAAYVVMRLAPEDQPRVAFFGGSARRADAAQRLPFIGCDL